MTIEAVLAADSLDLSGEPAFDITRPPTGVSSTALVFASPHSGRYYPQALLSASNLAAHAIRQTEDAWVDHLIDSAPSHGVSVLAARFARVWFDLNRDPWDLDPQMFADELPVHARGASARAAAGLGAIPRQAGQGREIYWRKLTFAEAVARVEGVHRPYHAALAGLVGETRQRFDHVVLLDWHSMPSAAARQTVCGGCDIAIGDRFGVSSAPWVSASVERGLRDLGYRVSRNAPYAGAYTLETYGRPAHGVHALQIEINRGLYLNERTLRPSANFGRLRNDLDSLFAALAVTNWAPG